MILIGIQMTWTIIWPGRSKVIEYKSLVEISLLELRCYICFFFLIRLHIQGRKWSGGRIEGAAGGSATPHYYLPPHAVLGSHSRLWHLTTAVSKSSDKKHAINMRTNLLNWCSLVSISKNVDWHFWGHSYGRKSNVECKPATEVYQED